MGVWGSKTQEDKRPGYAPSSLWGLRQAHLLWKPQSAQTQEGDKTGSSMARGVKS